MNDRYSRNRLYVCNDEQKQILNTKILIGGAGIGSIIAECALRFGFENITIVDKDKVELSNLNRQNYTEADLGKNKAECLANYLLKINSKANIVFRNCFITEENVKEIIKGHDIAINALDFNSKIPFIFDEECKKMNIPVLHPYNFGWAGFLAVVKPDSVQFSVLSDAPKGFELRVAEYVSKYCTYWNTPQEWLDKVINEFKNENGSLPPPQLSVASWNVAGHCVHTMYNLATGKEVDTFPKFYLSSIHSDKF